MNPWMVLSLRSDWEWSCAAKIAVAACPPSSVNSSWSSAREAVLLRQQPEMAIAPIGRFCTTSGMHTIGCASRPSAALSSRWSRRRDRLAEHARAERRLGKPTTLQALGGDRRAGPALAVDVDREHLGADQVDHDLDDDPQHLVEVERRVELVARRRRGSRGCCSPPRSRGSAVRTAVLLLERAHALASAWRTPPRGRDARRAAPRAASPTPRVLRGVVLPRLELGSWRRSRAFSSPARA